MCLERWVAELPALLLVVWCYLPPLKMVQPQPRTDFSNGLLSLMQTCRRELTDTSYSNYH